MRSRRGTMMMPYPCFGMAFQPVNLAKVMRVAKRKTSFGQCTNRSYVYKHRNFIPPTWRLLIIRKVTIDWHPFYSFIRFIK